MVLSVWRLRITLMPLTRSVCLTKTKLHLQTILSISLLQYPGIERTYFSFGCIFQNQKSRIKTAQPLKVSQQNVLYHTLRMCFSLYGIFQNFMHFILVNQYFFSISFHKFSVEWFSFLKFINFLIFQKWCHKNSKPLKPLRIFGLGKCPAIIILYLTLRFLL